MKKKPLHEDILDIMYQENKDIPAFLSPSDILWKIKDPEISERKIREVLDWLVVEKRVNVRAGKYQIDRYEFIDKSKADKSSKRNVKKVEGDKGPLFVYEEKKRLGFIDVVYAVICILCLVTYYFWPTKPLVSPQKLGITYRQIEMPKNDLYVSQSASISSKEKIKQISYSFYIQNKVNKELKATVDSLILDNRRLQMMVADQYDMIKESQEGETNKFFFVLLSIIVLLVGVLSVRLRI